jgi:hypothetical protein
MDRVCPSIWMHCVLLKTEVFRRQNSSFVIASRVTHDFDESTEVYDPHYDPFLFFHVLYFINRDSSEGFQDTL